MWHYATLSLVVIALASFQVQAASKKEHAPFTPFNLQDFSTQLDTVVLESSSMLSPAYLSRMSRKSAESLIADKLGVSSMQAWYKKLARKPLFDVFAVSSIVAGLTDEHLNNMEPEACALFLEFLELFRIAPLANKVCRAAFFSNLANVRPAALKAIPPSWMIEDGYNLINAVITKLPKSQNHLHRKTMVKVGRNPQNACSLLTISYLANLRELGQYWITKECMAVVQGLAKIDLELEFILLQKKDVFALYNGPLTDNTMRNMPGRHFFHLGSMVKDSVCEKSRVELVPEYLEYISPKCLKEFLKSCKFRAEGWHYLRPDLVSQYRLFLPDSLEHLLKNETFFFLPKELQLKVISDDNLYKIIEELGKTSALNSIRLSTREFCSLGSRAIRWLKANSRDLCDKCLARFEPEIIAGIFENPTSWDLLAETNTNIIRNLTTKSKDHYCSLLTMQQYKSNLVIRRFGGDACRKALKFERTEGVIKELPELAPLDNIPQYMINSDLEWWTGEGAILGMILIEINAPWMPPAESLVFMTDNLLSLIDNSISLYYRDFINPENATKLNANAFSDFSSFKRIELVNLSPAQIRKVSSSAFGLLCAEDVNKLESNQLRAINLDKLLLFGKKLQDLSEKALKHINFSSAPWLAEFITPKIAPTLNDQAFGMFTRNDFKRLRLTDLRKDQVQWLSVGVPVRESALWDNASTERDIMCEGIPNRQLLSEYQIYQQGFFNGIYRVQNNLDYLNANLGVNYSKFEAGCLFLEQLSYVYVLKIYDIDKEKLGDQIKRFMDRFSQSEKEELLKENIMSVPSAKLFFVIDHSLLLRPFTLLTWRVGIHHDGTKFDIVDSVRRIKSHSNIIAYPQTSIVPKGDIDLDQSTESWIHQMLLEILEKCTTEVSKSSYRKFSWLRHRDDGFIAGLLFGKVIQLGRRLITALDPEFYALIGNPETEQIEKYFKRAFAQEIAEYQAEYLGQKKGKFEFSLLLRNNAMVVDPSKLCFGSLEGSQANLIEFSTKDAIPMSLYSKNTIVTDYFDLDLMPRILDEFIAFVRRFNGGLNHVLDLERIHPMSSERLQIIFSELLNKTEFRYNPVFPMFK